MRNLIKKILTEEEDDFQWIRDIKPSWLRVGQKFTNRHNLENSRRYEPKDKVPVGADTFEIYDINEKDGKQYLRFTHNDTLDRYHKFMKMFGSPRGTWDMEREKQNSYMGLSFEKAEKNIDSGFWIPLIDCEFIPSTHPDLVGRVDSNGDPFGHTYCKPDTDYEHLFESSDDFDWIRDIPINIKVNSCDDLEAGDRVVVTSNHDDIDANEQHGTVYDINTSSEEVLIKFDTMFNSSLHDGYGFVEPRYWFFSCPRLGEDEIYKIVHPNEINESVKLPIEIGDTVYMGKFKNKKTVIKDIEWNDKGDLMINGKSALRVRIPKKAKKSIKEQDDFDWIRNI